MNAGKKGRKKSTVISIAVALENNICQSCLNDMEFGVPVGVRDKMLKEARENSSNNNSNNSLVIPRSEVGLTYHYQQQPIAENSLTNGNIYTIPETRQLTQFASSLRAVESKHKTAFRNLPKLCSFWLNNTCNRVLKNTCPFRPCCGAFAFPELASTNKEICNELIKDLETIGAAEVMRNMKPHIKQVLSSAISGVNRAEAIRQRITGQDDLSKKYLGRIKVNTLLKDILLILIL